MSLRYNKHQKFQLVIGRAWCSTHPMGMFHAINSLVVTRNLWLILFMKICFLNFVKHTSNNFLNSTDSKSALIFSLASVVVELFAILRLFNK